MVVGLGNARILLVDDDPAVSEGVACSLATEGYRVTTAADGITALSAVHDQQPDLIILDLMLPRLSGLDVCKTIRRDSHIPIIMLSAKDTEEDRVIGLELGADDYITKPFSTRELIARIRAILRRAVKVDESSTHIIKAAGITLDASRRTANVRGEYVKLTPREFDLLSFFIRNCNRVMDRQHLFRSVWGADSQAVDRTLDVHVRWLRKKIEKDPAKPSLIITIHGVGYKFSTDNTSHQDPVKPPVR